jgi:molybdenum cofactor biosynthesis enzyme
LTIYDMLKSKDKHMMILDILLESKAGGKSGEWQR